MNRFDGFETEANGEPVSGVRLPVKGLRLNPYMLLPVVMDT
jgi:hypothetical protein